MAHMFKQRATVTACVLALLAFTAQAQESNPEKDVYFGTTYGHSSWSIDAFALGNSWTTRRSTMSPPHGGHIPLVPKKD